MQGDNETSGLNPGLKPSMSCLHQFVGGFFVEIGDGNFGTKAENSFNRRV